MMIFMTLVTYLRLTLLFFDLFCFVLLCFVLFCFVLLHFALRTCLLACFLTYFKEQIPS